MILAGMLKTDEDALICDLAETYHIYDWQSYPLGLIATLAAGLRDDSRIKMRLAGCRVRPLFFLSALICDALNILVWQNTENGHKGVNAPPRIARILLGGADTEENGDTAAFDTPEEFERRRKEIIEELKHERAG